MESNKTFKVIHNKTGKEIDGAFILLPKHDSSARVALAAYAEATTNSSLARWIRNTLKDIHDKRKARREKKESSCLQ
jgi:hypothetical protein